MPTWMQRTRRVARASNSQGLHCWGGETRYLRARDTCVIRWTAAFLYIISSFLVVEGRAGGYITNIIWSHLEQKVSIVQMAICFCSSQPSPKLIHGSTADASLSYTHVRRMLNQKFVFATISYGWIILVENLLLSIDSAFAFISQNT